MSNKIREEEVKNKVAKLYFQNFDCTRILGDVDFCVAITNSTHDIFGLESFLWAEAKKEKDTIVTSIVQLILTIGKARTFDTYLPPAFLGSFDSEEIGIIPYNKIHDIFYVNDFNWKVQPSNHDTKEFKIIYEKVITTLNRDFVIFKFGRDDKEIKKYIKTNFVIGKTRESKIRIDKNNFMVIYNKWLQVVKPTIAVEWDIAKKSGFIDGDFYLADLLSKENNTLKEKLFVLLRHDHYELDRHLEESGMFSSKRTDFTDQQHAHIKFWNKYDRPPKKEYWEYIVDRRDLLVPQDVRERKGSFFTPKIWVEKSQEYLASILGEDWQDEYYIWDCAAGTGNLLTGLTNKYNIWASTLDQQDVDVMHDRIKNGANLLDDHVFQFDFLNDNFSKLPSHLQDIINDPEKRKKLVVYINPPYAEAGNIKQRVGSGKNKDNVSNQSEAHKNYSLLIKDYAKRELFVQFFARIYSELRGVILAEFSKLKILQSPYFADFRKYFLAKLEKSFVVPANSFDNVKGSFPIGFFIWNTNIEEQFTNAKTNVYSINGIFEGEKTYYSYDGLKNINDWLRPTWKKSDNRLAYITCNSNDFQNSTGVFIQLNKSNQTSTYYKPIDINNLIQSSIYFAVRHCIPATWLNDRDQFLYPNSEWEYDTEFQNDCLAFTLFNTNVKSEYGTNHWIPFTEQEVDAKEKFDSNFMSQYIHGKLKQLNSTKLFDNHVQGTTPLEFSAEAIDVFNAAKELWRYYHKQPNCNVNASLYDIREYFQGRNEKGKMNNRSTDEIYSKFIANLRDALIILSLKIQPKIYQYGFLKA